MLLLIGCFGLLFCTLVMLGSDGVVTIPLLVTQVSDHYSVTYRLDKTGIYMIHVLLFKLILVKILRFLF